MAPQKWEYLNFVWSPTQNRYLRNGQEHVIAPGYDIFMLLDDLGEQGWELVASTDTLAYYFKRPKQTAQT